MKQAFRLYHLFHYNYFSEINVKMFDLSINEQNFSAKLNSKLMRMQAISLIISDYYIR